MRDGYLASPNIAGYGSDLPAFVELFVDLFKIFFHIISAIRSTDK